MRWSNLFVPTLREAPAEADVASHRLLLRAGFIRQLHAGHYSLLPLGVRVHEKVADIVREEMDAIGGQEMLLPALHPAWVWEQSGRWESMGDEMFRLTDRRGAENALGMTHEEVIALLAREIHSYREVPQIWYQIQTKFRDEPRPKSGLLRVREFAMKDSYSLDIDDAGLDHAFDLHHAAYTRIFERLGLPAIAVEASSGAMGGSASVEFMVPSSAGEDDIARCGNCGYAANVERASAVVAPVEDPPGGTLERFATPGIRTIAALAAAEADAPPPSQIKTMVYVLDGQVTLVLPARRPRVECPEAARHQRSGDGASGRSGRMRRRPGCRPRQPGRRGRDGPAHLGRHRPGRAQQPHDRRQRRRLPLPGRGRGARHRCDGLG